MKKTVMLLAAVVLVTGCMPRSTPGRVQAIGGAERGQHMGNWQGRGPALGEQLNLTNDQKAKIKNIMDEQAAKIKEIRTATEGQVDAVFTPEQKTKIYQLRKEAQAKMKERMKKGKTAVGTGNQAAR